MTHFQCKECNFVKIRYTVNNVQSHLIFCLLRSNNIKYDAVTVLNKCRSDLWHIDITDDRLLLKSICKSNDGFFKVTYRVHYVDYSFAEAYLSIYFHLKFMDII